MVCLSALNSPSPDGVWQEQELTIPWVMTPWACRRENRDSSVARKCPKNHLSVVRISGFAFFFPVCFGLGITWIREDFVLGLRLCSSLGCHSVHPLAALALERVVPGGEGRSWLFSFGKRRLSSFRRALACPLLPATVRGKRWGRAGPSCGCATAEPAVTGGTWVGLLSPRPWLCTGPGTGCRRVARIRGCAARLRDRLGLG